jgi:transcriptional regulator MraZ
LLKLQYGKVRSLATKRFVPGTNALFHSSLPSVSSCLVYCSCRKLTASKAAVRVLMLLGEYHLSLDCAGWFSLPASIRYAMRQLYAPDDTALILTTFFEGCLVCYPVVEWYKAPERLARSGATPLDIRDFLRSSALCPLDTEGRLYLPRLFCEYAQIERDVLVVGVVCYLELWSPQRWEGYAAKDAGRL